MLRKQSNYCISTLKQWDDNIRIVNSQLITGTKLIRKTDKSISQSGKINAEHGHAVSAKIWLLKIKIKLLSKSLKFLTAEYTLGLFIQYDYHINLVIFLDIHSRCLRMVMLVSKFVKTPENMIDYSNTKYPMILFINVSYSLHMCHNLFRHWQPT